ncbi:MAG: hypothetical protein ACFFFG_06465 [Candidatus Thorarchaeota archaeon]
MPTISLSLSQAPYSQAFSFSPGEKINIHVLFEEGQIPESYRLQILDHKKNTRLNRYGKGFPDIVVNAWPIPTRLRDEHLGVWQVWIEDLKGTTKPYGHFFYVEKEGRREKPMLEGISVPELPEQLSLDQIMESEPLGGPEMVSPRMTSQTPTSVVTESAIPVTTIHGIGKTYADRLSQLNIFSVSDLWNFHDRLTLAQTMRVSDKKLGSLLQNASLILEREPRSGVYGSFKGVKTEPMTQLKSDDALRMSVTKIKGIGQVTARELSALGIITVEDFLGSSYADMDSITTKKTFSKWKNNASLLVSGPKGKKDTPPAAKSQILKPTKGRVTVDLKGGQLSSLRGIGHKTEHKLNLLGIYTVKDMTTYNNQEELRKALRMSQLRFQTFLNSLKLE